MSKKQLRDRTPETSDPNLIHHAKFDCSREDADLITQIVNRAVAISSKVAVLPESYFDRQTLHMDITACHCNGCSLDLDRLLAAPEFDFMHDVVGIQKNINRVSGYLLNFFQPRYTFKPKLYRDAAGRVMQGPSGRLLRDVPTVQPKDGEK